MDPAPRVPGVSKVANCEFGKTILHIAAMTGQTEKFIESFDEAEEKNPYDVVWLIL